MAFIKWKYLWIIKQIANRDNVWLLSTRETDDDSLRGMQYLCELVIEWVSELVS